MQIIIKKYERIDEEQFAQLLHLCFEEEYLLSVVYSSKLKFAYSAFFKNKLIGIVIAWTSSFHPYCTYFRILSNPLYKRLSIEEKLLSNIEKLETINFPLQTSVWETSTNLRKVYEKNGFIEIRRTYMPKLKVTDVKGDSPHNSEKHVMKTLEEVISNEVLVEKLTLVVKRNYEKTHVVNPVVEKGLEEWKEMILADDVVPNGSYIYLDIDEEDIIAYSFLHESDREDALELGWCGTSESQNKELIPQLTFQQIKYAIKHDIQFIVGEFDTTDKYAMEVLSTLPFAPCPTWITYQK
ncbi:hypothetical protein MHB48_09065 [Psychrobacillus sp. FSL H8-0483]|uniref:hypothetical protein n=1 Tax=Psychrobacillus sp. FSL H8-0483 TaxID=2921389 RepID=UPI00315A02B6